MGLPLWRMDQDALHWAAVSLAIEVQAKGSCKGMQTDRRMLQAGLQGPEFGFLGWRPRRVSRFWGLLLTILGIHPAKIYPMPPKEWDRGDDRKGKLVCITQAPRG